MTTSIINDAANQIIDQIRDQEDLDESVKSKLKGAVVAAAIAGAIGTTKHHVDKKFDREEKAKIADVERRGYGKEIIALEKDRELDRGKLAKGIRSKMNGEGGHFKLGIYNGEVSIGVAKTELEAQKQSRKSAIDASIKPFKIFSDGDWYAYAIVKFTGKTRAQEDSDDAAIDYVNPANPLSPLSPMNPLNM